MPKSRSFSIYLLKPNLDSTSSLQDGHRLVGTFTADNLPEDAVILGLDNPPKPPWWKAYFGVQQDITQTTKGAIIFLPSGERIFALCFGNVSHFLKDDSYEYDFGLRVTLNSVDPKQLKSTDLFEPGSALRRRIQVPTVAELTLFDFDKNSNILRSLTGRVRLDRKDLFKTASGSTNLKITTPATPDELTSLCSSLLEIYESDDFKETFKDIQNISPIKDPEKIDELDARLIDAVKSKVSNLGLTVPDIINYSEHVTAGFAGMGRSWVYDDVDITNYYDYLEKNEFDLNGITKLELNKHSLVLTNENDDVRERFRIYKALVFDVDVDGKSYHLAEGNWYEVKPEYVEKLRAYLDPVFGDTDLPEFNHDTEGNYNDDVAAKSADYGCLDTKDISPAGQTQIEPCDLIRLRGDAAELCHVKISTRSSTLSHHFNQAANSLELLRAEPASVVKLKALVDGAGAANADQIKAAIDNGTYRIVLAIITKKDPAKLSANLPLFSRISLMRALRSIDVMRAERLVAFVKDDKAPKDPAKPKNKPKKEDDDG